MSRLHPQSALETKEALADCAAQAEERDDEQRTSKCSDKWPLSGYARDDGNVDERAGDGSENNAVGSDLRRQFMMCGKGGRGRDGRR